MVVMNDGLELGTSGTPTASHDGALLAGFGNPVEQVTATTESKSKQTAVQQSSHWLDCLRYMSSRMKNQQYTTWIRPTRGELGADGCFRIAVSNQFVANWIDEHFRPLIDEAFDNVLGRRPELVFVIAHTDDEEQTSLPLDAPAQTTTIIQNGRPAVVHNLSERYRFDNLVVGDFNSFAHAASKAVAEAPAMTRYNPLFIYGGTGLGKTHIVQAIGHEIVANQAAKRVIYATSEKFTSDFIAAISDRSISDFTRMYRDVDVLIIDDIQFFTGKEGTQEQFFHTFNSLYHCGKQIILTSDRSPREIKGLEDRLLSRFSWGLVTDFQAPDFENRSAIILKKLQSEGMTLPDTVVRFLADTITTNVRELEGALTRILAYASHKKEAVNVEMARKVLSDTVSSSSREITIAAIQKKTCELFHIDAAMMTAKKKTAKIALARQVAMYLSRSLTDNSLKLIGASFGGRDHSTVIHACDLVSKRLSSDPSFREKIDRISASLLY